MANENYDSFIDYMFSDPTALMFIGGVLMLVLFGWWYGVYYVMMTRGKWYVRHKSNGLCLILAAGTTVITQLGMVLHEYYGKWVFALFLGTCIIFYTSTIVVMKKSRKKCVINRNP